MNRKDLPGDNCRHKGSCLQSISERVYYWSDNIWRLLDSIASRRGLAIILIGLFSLTGSSIVGTLSGIPQPLNHDEFSYLLAADTFASGRLTNPTHPMWEHFESFHIIHKPTYMSKYLPVQGLILAAGKVVAGHPIWGVWLSAALMCASITWMLHGWVPPKWAFLGGLIAAFYFGMFGYWSQSYWGGAVPATGGALVFGALRRVVSRQYIRDALLLGLGLTVLACSRPWEGMIASIPAGLMLFWWMFSKNSPPFKRSLSNIVLPVICVLIIAAGALGIYNRAVTGNALQVPYPLYEKEYFNVPIFIWQEVRPELEYRHEIMQRHNRDFSLNEFLRKNSLKGFFRSVKEVFVRTVPFYFKGPLRIPVIMIIIVLPYILSNGWMRLALLTAIAFAVLANPLVSSIIMPHYLAPVTSLAVLFIAQGLRCMYFLKLNRKSVGKILVLIFLFISIQHITLYPVGKIVQLKLLKHEKEYSWAIRRTQIINELSRDGGSHLIIVRYGPNHYPGKEWVYNEADIDNASVVWAREMDMNQNFKLLEYFKERKAWLLEVNDDNSPPQLITYQAMNDK